MKTSVVYGSLALLGAVSAQGTCTEGRQVTISPGHTVVHKCDKFRSGSPHENIASQEDCARMCRDRSRSVCTFFPSDRICVVGDDSGMDFPAPGVIYMVRVGSEGANQNPLAALTGSLGGMANNNNPLAAILDQAKGAAANPLAALDQARVNANNNLAALTEQARNAAANPLAALDQAKANANNHLNALTEQARNAAANPLAALDQAKAAAANHLNAIAEQARDSCLGRETACLGRELELKAQLVQCQANLATAGSSGSSGSSSSGGLTGGNAQRCGTSGWGQNWYDVKYLVKKTECKKLCQNDPNCLSYGKDFGDFGLTTCYLYNKATKDVVMGAWPNWVHNDRNC